MGNLENTDYLVHSPEELKELKGAMEVFFKHYVIEPKDNSGIMVKKVHDKYITLEPTVLPFETLYNIERSETPKVPTKVIKADFIKDARILELLVGDWTYLIHFGEELGGKR